MAWNEYRPRGAAKGYEPTSGGAVSQPVPKFGIVKDNIDPLRCGRLRVYIEGMSGLDPDDADSWVTVQYMSAFYGQTLSTSPKTGYGTYNTNTHSYGMWAPAPDIGTTVVLLFINGDPNYGVWIGAVPEPATLQMVPAIGAAIPGVDIVPNPGEGVLGGATRLPAVNMNSNNTDIMKSSALLTYPRPIHSYTAGILFNQGLIRDPLRGVIGSSAQRETPSRVMGISTPGRPNYSGGYTDETVAKAVTTNSTPPENLKIISRRGGHSLVMDDGDIIGRDQMIRLRTAMGHQILMSDDGQCLFIIHSNGKSWIELGKEGTIDMFSTNSVNIRTAGDLNLHADNNINMYAKNNINASTETMTIETAKDTNVRAGGDWLQQVVGKYTVKVGDVMSMASAGEGSYYSDATMYINGKIINLNSGKSSTVPQKVKPIPVVMHTDTLFDKSKGWLAAPGKLPSIVSRAPAHTPWDAAGSGVSVKVELNADNALPADAAPAVTAANQSAATQAATPATATAATSKTVPLVGATSGAIDKAATATAVSTIATVAAKGPAAAAAAVGGGVVDVAGTKIPVVGQTAQTAAQMATGGIIKPGSQVLINGLAQSGLPLEKIMPPNLLSGLPGAETVQQFAKNVTAQTTSLVKNFQNAQAGLQAAGVITGKESSSSIMGTVMAAATNGVAATVNNIKNAASGLVNGAVGALTGAATTAASKVLGGVTAMMNAGNKAGALAGALGGGLSALSGSVSSMASQFGKTASALFDTAKGAAAGAFNALKASLPTLKPGIPQNVKKIAEEAAAKAQSASGATDLLSGGVPKLGDAIGGVAGAITSGLGSVQSTIDQARATASTAIGSATGSLLSAAGAAQSAFNSATASVNQVVGTVNKVGLDANKLISAGGGIASGLNLIPGGVASVMSSANNIGQSLKDVGSNPTDTVQSLATGINTGINAVSSAIDGAKTAIAGGQSQITNLLSGGLPKLGGDPAASIASSASGALASITGGTGALKNQISNAGGSIKDLALKGLSPAAAGQLQGAIAGLSGGDTSVSLPILATNTSDFGKAADAAISSIMGPGISPPNYNGNPATMGESEAIKLLDNTAQFSGKVVASAAAISESTSNIANAANNYANAAVNQIEGSPQIAAAKQALDNAVGSGLKIRQDAANLLSSATSVAGAISKFPRG